MKVGKGSKVYIIKNEKQSHCKRVIQFCSFCNYYYCYTLIHGTKWPIILAVSQLYNNYLISSDFQSTQSSLITGQSVHTMAIQTTWNNQEMIVEGQINLYFWRVLAVFDVAPA